MNKNARIKVSYNTNTFLVKLPKLRAYDFTIPITVSKVKRGYRRGFRKKRSRIRSKRSRVRAIRAKRRYHNVKTSIYLKFKPANFSRNKVLNVKGLFRVPLSVKRPTSQKHTTIRGVTNYILNQYLLTRSEVSLLGGLRDKVSIKGKYSGFKLRLLYNQKIRISSKINKPFIIANVGMFIFSRFNFFKPMVLNLPFKYRFKKQFYSFLQPNFLKKSIFLKKRRIITSRFFYKHKNPRKPSVSAISRRFWKARFSYKHMFSKFTSFFTYDSANYLAGKGTSINNISTFYNHYYDRMLYTYKDSKQKFGDLHRYGEVFIPRVRFKPGYQRI